MLSPTDLLRDWTVKKSILTDLCVFEHSISWVLVHAAMFLTYDNGTDYTTSTCVCVCVCVCVRERERESMRERQLGNKKNRKVKGEV